MAARVSRRVEGRITTIAPAALTGAPRAVPRGRVRPVSLAARIAQLEAELADVRRQQHAQFLVTIGSVMPGEVDFNARELFAFRSHHPALAGAFTELGIHNARCLGRQLQQIAAAGVEAAGLRLQRIGHDRDGVVWTLR